MIKHPIQMENKSQPKSIKTALRKQQIDCQNRSQSLKMCYSIHLIIISKMNTSVNFTLSTLDDNLRFAYLLRFFGKKSRGFAYAFNFLLVLFITFF